MSRAEARPAATVAIVRSGDGVARGGMEVLLGLRHAKMAFMGQVWVFPGGKVDAEDGDGEGGARRAAIREAEEEVGIALAGPLVPFARWVTPPSEPRRFDTWFFLAEVDRHAELRLAEAELVAAEWMSPLSALERHARGELALAPPTWWTLEALRRVGDVERALAWARRRAAGGIEPLTPTLALEGGGIVVTVPADALPLPDDRVATPLEGSGPASVSSGRLVMRRGVWSRE